MNILIISSTHDTHAQLVAAALRLIGAEVQYLANPHFVDDIRYNIKVGNRDSSIQIAGSNLCPSMFDLVWLRRLPFADVPKHIHKDDVDFTRAENIEFNRQFLSLLQVHGNWLHKYNILMNSENKIAQLFEAERIGMNIPDTLISNDSSEIMNFVKLMQERGAETIFKSFDTNVWIESDGTNRIGLTNTVNIDDVRDELVVGAAPGIFQQKIEKAFEVRVNIFGDQVTAIKINSNTSDDAKNDWRASIALDSMLEKYDLPECVEYGCKKLMGYFKIETGCFDFIADNFGKFFFVDLNPQGQFLWIEEALPHVKLLRSFVSFMVSKCGDEVDILRKLDVIDLSLAAVEGSKYFRLLQRQLAPGQLLNMSTSNNLRFYCDAAGVVRV